MRHTRLLSALAATAATGLVLSVTAASAADVLLSGAIKSASGEKMGGVTRLGQGRGLDHHHLGLHRRSRRLLLPAARKPGNTKSGRRR